MRHTVCAAGCPATVGVQLSPCSCIGPAQLLSGRNLEVMIHGRSRCATRMIVIGYARVHRRHSTTARTL